MNKRSPFILHITNDMFSIRSEALRVLSWSINFFSRADIVNISVCVCVLAHTVPQQAIYWLISHISEVRPSIIYSSNSPSAIWSVCVCVRVHAWIHPPPPSACVCVCLCTPVFVKLQQKWKGLILRTVCRLTHPNSRLSGTHTHSKPKGQSDLLAASGPQLLKHQPHRWWLMDFNFLSPCSFLCLPAGAWILGFEQQRGKERRLC